MRKFRVSWTTKPPLMRALHCGDRNVKMLKENALIFFTPPPPLNFHLILKNSIPRRSAQDTESEKWLTKKTFSLSRITSVTNFGIKYTSYVSSKIAQETDLEVKIAKQTTKKKKEKTQTSLHKAMRVKSEL